MPLASKDIFISPVYNPDTGDASVGRASFHPAAMAAFAAKGARKDQDARQESN